MKGKRNKNFFIMIAVLLSVLMFIPTQIHAHADTLTDIWNELVNYNSIPTKENRKDIKDIKSDVESIKEDIENVKDDINDNMADKAEEGVGNYFDSKTTTSDKGAETVFSISDMLIQTANDQWKMVGSAMQNTGVANEWGFALNAADYGESGTSNYIFIIFRTFAYSLVLVFFSANLIETSIKYEIFTLRGGANVFGRLLLSKVIIDKSGAICLAILKAVGDIASKIIIGANATIELNVPDFKSSLVKSDLWIIGTLVDSLSALVIVIPVAIVALVALVAACLVTVKLILRSIELCLMVAVSPTFFACFSSEVSRPYFRNFVVTFIQVAVELLFMAVVYAVCASWITKPFNGDTTTVIKWFMSFLPNALILLTMAISMVKPPKVLTGLLH